MEILLGLIFLFCVSGLPGIIIKFKFNNRLPLGGYRVDHGAMSHDLAMGKSKNDKCIRDGYDIKK